MKKLTGFIIAVMCLCQVSFAQSDDMKNNNAITTMEKYDGDYEKYLNNQLDIDYRQSTMETMNFTNEELVAFGPYFTQYMKEKGEKFEKKLDLIEDFREEMAENDSEKNQNEDRADFIEDYWEIEIEEMDMRKDLFDKLEDKISKDKAAKFMYWVIAVENTLSNKAVADIMPAVYDLNKYSAQNPSWSQAGAKSMRNKTIAPDEKVDAKKYRKYIDSKLEMDFRNETIRALNLSKKEIIKFDDFFFDYMVDRENLLENRMNLMEDFREELAEDDSKANEAEDRTDYIEDYWETVIAEKELRKEAFDELESKINKVKAAKFFFWENAIENRIVMNSLMDVIPTFAVLETPRDRNGENLMDDDEVVMIGVDVTEKGKNMNLSASTRNQIESFDKWVNDNRGKVSLSHDYTSNGLKAAMNAIESMKNDRNLNIAGFATKKAMIMNNAERMTADWKSLDHADMAKEAFLALSDLMANFNENNMTATSMRTAANSINVDKKLTPQASKIYDFFDATNKRLQQIYQSGMTSSK